MNDDLAKLVTTAALTRTFTQTDADLWKMVSEIERRSGISRRAFLGGLMATAATVAAGTMLPGAIDPEKILWMPGQKALLAPASVLASDNHALDAIQYALADIDRVLRYLGKKNFGSKWEPNGTQLSAIATLSDEEFESVLDRARPYAH